MGTQEDPELTSCHQPTESTLHIEQFFSKLLKAGGVMNPHEANEKKTASRPVGEARALSDRKPYTWKGGPQLEGNSKLRALPGGTKDSNHVMHTSS